MFPTNTARKDTRVRNLLSQGTGAIVMAALFAFGACSTAEPAPAGGSGGSQGGGSGGGGRTGTGGNQPSGSGGSSSSGGSTGSGGSTASGGSTGSGGTTASGGSTGSGGTSGGSGGSSGDAAAPADMVADVPPVSNSGPCNTMPAATPPALRRGTAITGFTGMRQAGQIIGAPGEPNTMYVLGHEDGNVFTVQNGAAVPTPLVKVNISSGSAGNEQGLLSMAFHPQFATNKLFYLFYTAPGGGALTVDEFERMTPTTAMFKQNIFSRPRDGGTTYHNGGSITFNPKDTMPYMYFSIGNTFGNGAGSPTGFFGRVLRIDVSNKMATTYVHGLRNPYRMSIDRLTGDMFISDVANGTGGSIIYNPAGMMGRDFGYRNNNGSPEVNGGVLRDGAGLAIIGGYVYRGNKIPGLCGRYFYGNWSTGTVKSIVVQNGQMVGSAVTHGTLSVPGRITSFGEDSEGELWMASMNNNAIYKIEAAPPAP